MIPKKIHYCWFGQKPFPKLVKKCLETWKVHFPDYEFHLWNETNSPMEVPYVREAYDAKKYAFVSDYVRFWALHNKGGIYLDTDMFVTRNMDELLENSCFFGWEKSDCKNISCGAIGCASGNEFVKEIINEYKGIHYKNADIEKLVIPRFITAIYNKSSYKDNVQILPYDYFYPFPYEHRNRLSKFNTYATENTYAIHLWNLSWVSNYDKLLSNFVKAVKKHL